MKELRVPQLRMVEHLRCDDIRFGLAIVKASKLQGSEGSEGSEGWTLPGCVFTRNRVEAYNVCKKMHNMIEAAGGIPLVAKNKRAA